MFRYDDSMYHRYRTEGYIIFRGILPWSLVSDLRREADKARDIAHKETGPQSQRIQPIFKYADRINTKPFEDYLEFPALRDAVHKILSPLHTHGTRNLLGLLIEPAKMPWHLGWHRDGVIELPHDAYDDEVKAALQKTIFDERIWNQVNCALYAESCTWFVPGSHLRMEDLPGEIMPLELRTMNRFDHLDPVDAEYRALQEVRAMPGAVQVQLQAGDYFMYRNLGWHTGNYLSYQPRATLHDIVTHPTGGEGWEPWSTVRQAAMERYKQNQEAKNQNATNVAV